LRREALLCCRLIAVVLRMGGSGKAGVPSAGQGLSLTGGAAACSSGVRGKMPTAAAAAVVVVVVVVVVVGCAMVTRRMQLLLPYRRVCESVCVCVRA
jgi:hypothetical protein